MFASTHAPSGYSLIELLLTVGIAAALAGIAVPLASATVDDLRAASAARHVAARIATLRLDAVRRASSVALRFQKEGGDYSFIAFLDGNGNGVRTNDINRGVDPPLTAVERLSQQAAGTAFGLLPGIPDLDGSTASTDGVRIGSSLILSLAPNGSATGGTLYVHGRRAQYAIRVLGATGRVRVFQFDTGARRWINK